MSDPNRLYKAESGALSDTQHTERSQELGSNPKTTEFTIDRKTWLRGEGGDDSSLLRPCDGKMCCLGFYSLACGLAPSAIEDAPMPSQITLPEEMGWLIQPFSEGAPEEAEDVIAVVNDSPSIPAREREKQIRSFFAKHGITVKFTGRTK